ncbi:MAG: hypothetical protein ABIK27_03635 [Bacteroidota bacterium]|uniref:Phage protein n=1 Tax=viral metagenome TaxID=1070528 RepID=A0A6M3X506_9ZZZZ
MKYELEKVRMNYEKDWVYTTIQESDNEDALMEMAKKTKVRFGKTFEEKLNLNHIDEYGDIVHVDGLKYTVYDLKNKLKPYIVDNTREKMERK